MPRKIRHTARVLVLASSGLLMAGSVGVATAAAASGRPTVVPAEDAAPAARSTRLRHAVAMPFFSFRRGG